MRMPKAATYMGSNFQEWLKLCLLIYFTNWLSAKHRNLKWEI